MAISKDPKMEIKLTFDDQKSLQEYKKTKLKIESSGKVHEQKLQEINEKGQIKRRLQEQTHQDRLRRLRQTAQERALIKQKEFQAKSATSAKSWSSKMTTATQNVARGIGIMIAAFAVAKVREAVSGVIDWAGEMTTFAGSVGLSVEKFSALEFAATNTGTKMQTFQNTVVNIRRVMEDSLQNPTGRSALLFKQLGIDAKDSLDSVINQLIKTNEQGKVALLLGARQANALGRIRGRYDDLTGAINSATEAGAILSKESADNLDDLSVATANLNRKLKIAFVEILANNAPQIEKAIENFTKSLNSVDWTLIGNIFGGIFDAFKGIFNLLAKTRTGIIISKIFGVSDAEKVNQNIININKSLDETIRKTIALKQERDKGSINVNRSGNITNLLTTPQQQASRVQGLIESIGILPPDDFPFTDYWNPFLEKSKESVQDAYEDVYGNEPLLEKVLIDYSTGFTRFMDQFGPVINQSFELVGSLLDNGTLLYQNQLTQLQTLMQLENERWVTQSAALHKAGLENTTYYRNLRRDHELTEAKNQKTELELKSKLFDTDKQNQISRVIMSTAQGIAAAWTFVPPQPWLSAALTTLITATGANQIANISAQSNPYKRQFGGIIPGVGFSDTVPLNATPGEFVVNRESTRQNAQLLEAINSGQQIQPSRNVYLTIQGNIIGNKQYVEEDLLPQIRESLHNGFELN